ncbi:caspase family protein [Vacuolonema iberomarrocanum]|uniref:caspase family protein n=1 Tax=Vacuolonema iberomarrocanum TaxID=3454632 RepID=UPI001A05F8B2|nr:caspase family protein [filamentous cyanobacterium LEGE 07170]
MTNAATTATTVTTATKNYWAIAIGVNQYEHFQPLLYAERDAQAMQNFWVTEAGIPVENCFILSDNSPDLHLQSTFPSRDNIIGQVTDLCQQHLKAGDVLWLFFSGYGAQEQGQDFLLPIDADPAQLADTGIAVEQLFNILQTAPTDSIFVLLDMNRSQGTLGGEGAGQQTLQLAQEMQLPVVVSCPPNQFSHETLLLRQGLFTTAVLEGVRSHGCVTPEQLAQFLRDRLPNLSEQHWRPRQDPVAVIPDTQRFQLFLPGKPLYPNYPVELPDHPDGQMNGQGLPDGEEPGAIQSPVPQPQPLVPTSEGDSSNELSEGEDDLSWQRFTRWGGALLLALLALVVIRNVETVLSRPTEPDSAPGDSIAPAPIGGPTTVPTPMPIPTEAQPGEPLPPDAVPPAPTSPEELPAVGFGADGTAQAAMGQNESMLDRNRRILDQARAALTQFRGASPSNQTTEFSDAIAQARQIQPGEPLYEEAQQDIDRWSQMILDMAIGRAARRNMGDSVIAAQNYHAAIAAAGLIPDDRPEIYDRAQRSIVAWSQDTMRLANLHASEGVLALAIDVAQWIPPNTPTYAEAQQAIALWQSQLAQQQPPISSVEPLP